MRTSQCLGWLPGVLLPAGVRLHARARLALGATGHPRGRGRPRRVLMGGTESESESGAGRSAQARPAQRTSPLPVCLETDDALAPRAGAL